MPDIFLHELPHIRQSLDYLLEEDPVFSQSGLTLSGFNWPCFDKGFAGFARIVAGQQISTAAAASVWRKMTRQISPMTPDKFLAQSGEELKNAGLSGQKQRYLKGLAEQIETGGFDPAELENLPDDAVSRKITKLTGFGEWSANMYLLFALHHPDVLPAGDLGIRYGLQRYLGLTEPPDIKTTMRESRRFSPHRTAASLLLWSLKDA
mgnify:CR=1 FL=1